MSVSFNHKGRNVKQVIGSQLRVGNYIYGPSCGLPIVVTKQPRSGCPVGVRLDNGNEVMLNDNTSYTLLDVFVEFSAQEV